MTESSSSSKSQSIKAILRSLTIYMLSIGYLENSMDRLKVKVAVYIILIKENKILLSRRFNTGWQDGNYGLPAGHVESDEKVIDALLREATEEVGVKLNGESIIFVHCMYRKNSYTDFYFLAKNWTGDPTNMEPDKCDDLQWFSLDSLPSNMIPSVKSAILNSQNGVLFSDFESEE